MTLLNNIAFRTNPRAIKSLKLQGLLRGGEVVGGKRSIEAAKSICKHAQVVSQQMLPKNRHAKIRFKVSLS